MATWAKIKFFYATMLGSAGSTLTASSTATGDYDVDYLYNMLETNMWKAAAAGNQTMFHSGTELLTTTDFEVDTIGWNMGVWTRSNVKAKNGSWSIASPPDGSGGGGQAYCQSSGGITASTVKPNTTYTFHAWVWSDTPNQAKLTMAFGSVGAESAYHPGDSTWRLLTVTEVVGDVNVSPWLAFHKAIDAGQAYFDYCGVGEAYDVDCLAILGHNLFTAGTVLSLEYSPTGAFAGEQSSVFYGITLPSDGGFLREFTSQKSRYWKLSVNNNSVAPYMTLCIWGNKTELDYASASFDPYAETAKANVNITQGGYMAGTHMKFTERSLVLRFSDADSAIYDKVKAWWDVSGLNNFFVAWETANNPNDVYLMRPDLRFNNPLTKGGAYRDININLKGRKE